MRSLPKYLALAVTALILVVALLLAAAWVVSGRRMSRVYAVTEEAPLAIPADDAAIERGRHLATSVNACADCHGPDLGGRVFIDAGPLGVVIGSNLTRGRGGLDASYTVRDWERAIRHGLRRDGTSLVVMPSETFVHLSDADFAAIVAFLNQLAPVDRELPRTHLRWFGRVLMAAGRLPLLVAPRIHDATHVASIDATPSPAYGRYLADVGGCTGCHGPGLSGGPLMAPGAPPAANLTPTGLGRWSEADFVRALRERTRPDGTAIDPTMPAILGNMDDGEMHALWLYFRGVPPRPSGNR